MKKTALFLAVASAALALTASRVIAIEITRGFNLDFTSGALAGQTFVGTFSYDAATLAGTGAESLGPVGGAVFTPGFLSFDVTVGADTFLLSGAALSIPRLDFSDGTPTGVSYMGFGSAAGLLAGGGFGAAGDFFYQAGTGGSSTGTITLKPVTVQILGGPIVGPANKLLANSVPESGSTLLMLGMVVLGYAVRRGRR